jgi:hypothetical protein
MQDKDSLNHSIAVAGWGALFVWWGIALMIDPITLGMTGIGTGLILLGVNLARWLKGIPARYSSAIAGVIALTWGVLDQGRYMLALPAGLSFALLMVVIGLAIWFGPTLLHLESE